MPSGRNKKKMLAPTLFMAAIAFVLLLIAWSRGAGEHVTALRMGLAITLQTLPLVIFAFVIAGFVQVLLPHDLLYRWVGPEAGLRGIVIGTLAGGITPGGPYVSLPIVAGLLRTGAGAGTMVAFLTSWSLWAMARLPMELGLLGWRFTLIRLASTFFFPPIAGFLAHIISRALA